MRCPPGYDTQRTFTAGGASPPLRHAHAMYNWSLRVFLWDDDLSVTDFIGDSSPERGTSSVMASPCHLPLKGKAKAAARML